MKVTLFSRNGWKWLCMEMGMEMVRLGLKTCLNGLTFKIDTLI